MKITLPPITPGDWQESLGTIIEADNSRHSFREICSFEDAETGAVETAANKKAIAALPALIRALSEAYRMLCSIHEKEGYPGILHNDAQDAESEARAALTLAGCVIKP